MNRSYDERFKTVLQVLAILALTAMLSMIAHKAFIDITGLAQQHPGAGFWPAFGRYLLGNLGGG